MKKFILAIIAAITVSLLISCGAKLNSPTNPDYEPVLPDGRDDEEEDIFPSVTVAEGETTAFIPKYSKYFDVVVSETEDGILYLPYIDEDGNETDDIIVVGYNGPSMNVKIPPIIDGGNVIAISEGAFYGRGNVSSITLPDSIREIGRAAFSSCPNLTSIKFGEGVKELPHSVLRNCKVLKEVILPDTLEVIGDFAFEGCIKLETLYIPATVREIGHDAFMTCERLTLDVSDNEYAAEYSRNNNVNIDINFSYTSFRRRVIIGLSIGALVAAVSLGVHFFLRRKKETRT